MTIASGLETDISVTGTAVYFLPVQCEVPLTFGSGSVTSITCARVSVTITTEKGRVATGWGEVPLNGVWAWPTADSDAEREQVLRTVCIDIARALRECRFCGHPVEVSRRFMREVLPYLTAGGTGAAVRQQIPGTVALLCMTPFDLALYDAFGRVHNLPVIETLGPNLMRGDLSACIEDDECEWASGIYPRDVLAPQPKTKLPVWHLVGASDPLEDQEHPLPSWSLREWIQRDGIQALKVKLLGRDIETDAQRYVRVFTIGSALGVRSYSLDLNAAPSEADYVVRLFDRLETLTPEGFALIVFVEEPFPPDRFLDRVLVRDVARRKPLFMDENATGWRQVRLGYEAGWTGVALKTCKTLTESLCSLAWARRHAMPVVVQDLTNPMLAQLTHLWFASYVDQGHGVESNAMQFYPGASGPEAKVHPGAYRRRNGLIDISSLHGPGFGYRLEEINRELPQEAA